MLVKTVSGGEAHSKYKWHEMTFCSRWDSSHCTVLCIGIDEWFETLLHDILRRTEPSLSHFRPWTMIVPLVEVIVAIYDKSIWDIRDMIRYFEKASKTKLGGATNEG